MFKYIIWRFLIAAAAALLAGFCSWLYFRDATTTYEAQAKILIDQPLAVGTPGGANIPYKIQQLMPTYAEVVMSAGIRRKVLSRLPGISAAEIDADLRAAGLEKTQILAVTASDGDPGKATLIAQAAAESFIEAINEEQNGGNLKPQDRFYLSIITPAEEARALAPPKRRATAVAAAAGGILALSAIFVCGHAGRLERV